MISEKQAYILRAMAEDKTYAQIARELGVTRQDVSNTVMLIIRARTEIVKDALELLEEPPPIDHEAGEIIDDLQQQIDWIYNIEAHQFPGWGHTVLAMNRAIRKLKAQEPVKPLVCYMEEHDGHGSQWYVCGACDKPIDPADKYCRHCGRAVKWE